MNRKTKILITLGSIQVAIAVFVVATFIFGYLEPVESLMYAGLVYGLLIGGAVGKLRGPIIAGFIIAMLSLFALPITITEYFSNPSDIGLLMQLVAIGIFIATTILVLKWYGPFGNGGGQIGLGLVLGLGIPVVVISVVTVILPPFDSFFEDGKEITSTEADFVGANDFDGQYEYSIIVQCDREEISWIWNDGLKKLDLYKINADSNIEHWTNVDDLNIEFFSAKKDEYPTILAEHC